MLPVGREVVVIGGGNTAIDVATQSKRLGAEDVTIVYRRGPESMSATGARAGMGSDQRRQDQVLGAAARAGRSRTASLREIEFEYTVLDEAGRLAGTGEFFGFRPTWCSRRSARASCPRRSAKTGLAEMLEFQPDGRFAVNEDRQTSLANVFGRRRLYRRDQDLTVSAVQDGKVAALAIHRLLTGS